MFVPRTNLTRRQTVERVAFLKPKTSFRSGFAYDNILYAVAGQLIEEVTGQRWEDYMADNVQRPGGMKTGTAASQDGFGTPNRSTPEGRGVGKEGARTCRNLVRRTNKKKKKKKQER